MVWGSFLYVCDMFDSSDMAPMWPFALMSQSVPTDSSRHRFESSLATGRVRIGAESF